LFGKKGKVIFHCENRPKSHHAHISIKGHIVLRSLDIPTLILLDTNIVWYPCRYIAGKNAEIDRLDAVTEFWVSDPPIMCEFLMFIVILSIYKKKLQ